MKSAKWWMSLAGALWLSVGCALGATETETVDGIKWTYTVSGGIASLGGAGVKAVPTSTIGAIAIPSSLGGYPVRSMPSLPRWEGILCAASGTMHFTVAAV